MSKKTKKKAEVYVVNKATGRVVRAVSLDEAAALLRTEAEAAEASIRRRLLPATMLCLRMADEYDPHEGFTEYTANKPVLVYNTASRRPVVAPSVASAAAYIICSGDEVNRACRQGGLIRGEWAAMTIESMGQLDGLDMAALGRLVTEHVGRWATGPDGDKGD